MNNKHSNYSGTSENKRLRAALVMVLLVLAASLLNFSSSYAGDGIRPIGDLSAEPPEITAKAATMYAVNIDKTVYAKNENKKLPPYSATKFLTCYLALENLDPDRVVTASENATQVYENGTTIFLKPGEQMKVRDLVYGALMESGNDAAYALGEAVSGSEENFARLMNETVAGWGCSDTHFVNANGWKNEKHYTTAHDLSIIARHCFENKTLLDMSVTKEYTIPATNMSSERKLQNYTLYAGRKVSGVLGGKTGSWSDDDCAIILGFEREGLDSIIVLLGDTKEGRTRDAAKLADFAGAVTPGFLVCDKGDVADTVRVRHGAETKTDILVDGRTLAYPESCSEDDVRVTIDEYYLEAPVRKGDKAGTYSVYVDGEKIAEHDLIASEDIEVGWFPSYFYISNAQTIRICRILGVIMACAVILAVILRIAGKHRKKRSGLSDERQKAGETDKTDKTDKTDTGSAPGRGRKHEPKHAKGKYSGTKH